MNNLIIMILCLSAGIVLMQTGKFQAGAHQALNTIIVYISLPALTLLNLHQISFTNDFALSAAVPWVLFVVGCLTFFLVGRLLKLSNQTVGALSLVGGLGNTSFVGVPMVEALQGKGGIPYALVIDQAGTYMVLSTLGMLVVSLYCSTASSPSQILKKIYTFPPFIAMCLAFLVMDMSYPIWLVATLKRLGEMLAPLALLSVGMQIRLGDLVDNKRALAVGLTFKLLMCPAMVLMGFWLLQIEVNKLSSHVILLESAMGPAIGAGIVASQNSLNPALTSLMIGVGVPLCLITVPAWSYGMTFVGL
jgi:predicted permease